MQDECTLLVCRVESGRFNPQFRRSVLRSSLPSDNVVANVTVHLEHLPTLETVQSEGLSGPFSVLTAPFRVFDWGPDGVLPHIASLRTTTKNSSHWASAPLLGQCG